MGKQKVLWEGVNQRQVILALSEDIVEYVDWYSENGMYLPEEYSKDPAEWTYVLQGIKESVLSLKDNELDEKDPGIKKLYKHFSDLWK
jgi:hypothetical protein